MFTRRLCSTGLRRAIFRHPSAYRRLGATAILVLVPATIGIASFAVSELPRMGRIAARQELTYLGGRYSYGRGGPPATPNRLLLGGLANLLHVVGLMPRAQLAACCGTGPDRTRASGLIRPARPSGSR